MKRIFVMLVIVLSFGLSICRPVQARPLYKSVYEDLFKVETKGGALTCARCHPGSDKKELNTYGKKLEEELGEKNVKDKEKIREALKKIGSGIVPKKNQVQPMLDEKFCFSNDCGL